jgi:hypothetical protein
VEALAWRGRGVDQGAGANAGNAANRSRAGRSRRQCRAEAATDAKIHALEDLPGSKQLGPLGDAYRPWRSAAAFYCWRALELSRKKK